MPHSKVHNKTRFAYHSLVFADEEAVPQFVTLVQGTYSISHDGAEVLLLDEQPAPRIAGEWFGDPETSSMKFEPQIAFTKPATDIVMLGSAHAPNGGTTRMQVGIRVAGMQKLLNVIGSRRLISRLGSSTVTDPEPFETMPLIYERAFGGWDRRAEDPNEHRCEARNPVGVGFRAKSGETDEEVILPNIEHPEHPFRFYGDTPPPAGFGFIGPHWQPRAAFAGTFDEAWDRSRKPLLPKDFDRRFYNGAAPDLVAPGYLRGDEPVVTIGAAPQGRVAFHLPGAPPPACVVNVRGRQSVELQTVLDTVIVDMDAFTLTLQWRAHLAVRNGMHDVVSIDVLPGGSA
jgi:hypothetical protein